MMPKYPIHDIFYKSDIIDLNKIFFYNFTTLFITKGYHMSQIVQSFTHSIRLPSKNSVFYLNRIGMDVTVIYLFILLAIASFPTLIEQILNRDSLALKLDLFFFFIYFFIFHYLIINLIVFSLISILAFFW